MCSHAPKEIETFSMMVAYLRRAQSVHVKPREAQGAFTHFCNGLLDLREKEVTNVTILTREDISTWSLIEAILYYRICNFPEIFQNGEMKVGYANPSRPCLICMFVFIIKRDLVKSKGEATAIGRRLWRKTDFLSWLSDPSYWFYLRKWTYRHQLLSLPPPIMWMGNHGT